jgi:membrane dipeptidase
MDWNRRQWGSAVLGAASAALAGLSCSPSGESTGAAPAAGSKSEGSLLERAIVLDTHCDTPMRIVAERFDLGQRHDFGQVDIPRMRQGGLTGVFFSIYTSAARGTPLEASQKGFQIIDAVINEVNRHPDDLLLATSTGQIREAKQHGKIAILMGVEGGHMIDSDLAILRGFYRLGARYMTLTHSADTPWAGSSGAKTNRGLSDFGREVVAEMNALGMMADISHVSDQTFFDVLEATKAPLIASHSSCRAIANHPRNMTDDMIEALGRNGGVMHINFYNSFLDDEHRQRDNTLKELEAREKAIEKDLAADSAGREAALRKVYAERIALAGRVPFSRLIDHIEHAAKIAGADHVGLGSDFDGVNDQLPQGMEDISKFPSLIGGLRERGFADDDIEKILGGNTLRVMGEVEKASAAGQRSPSQTA